MEAQTTGALPDLPAKVQNLNFEAIFSEICCGNRDAFNFCVHFLLWVQLIDDAIDRDKPLGEPEIIARINLEALMTFAFNPFWQEHKKSLMSLVIQGTKAFADSLEWEKRENFRDRAAADVLKSQYQEVFWHVARICGGYDHMDAVTKKYRHYQYDAIG